MFEVVHEKIGRTAWAGDSAWATDLLRGPSGRGLDDSCGFEQGIPRERDQVRVSDLLRWIDAKGCDGAAAQVPALFGMTFASVAAAQSDQHMGYTDALGTPSAGLTESLAFVDSAIGHIVQALDCCYLCLWLFPDRSPRDEDNLARSSDRYCGFGPTWIGCTRVRRPNCDDLAEGFGKSAAGCEDNQ
jgi:hypothetical protein